MSKKIIFLTILCFMEVTVILGAAPLICRSESLIGKEYRVKAGFIYNFSKFTRWPDASFSDEILHLIVVSKKPETNVFFQLDGKKIKGKTIKISKFLFVGKKPFSEEDFTIDAIDETGETIPMSLATYIAGLQKSHLIFLAASDKAVIEQHIKWTRGRNILTVGESKDFLPAGGIINFFFEENRLRFMVNIDAVNQTGLSMSSQLLMSADIYRATK